MSRLRSRSLGDYIINVLMIVICFLAIYPVWYSIIISFSDSNEAMKGGIYLLPRKFSLQSYKTVFQDSSIISAFIVTIARTVIGTVISVFFTAMVGYALSKKYIMGNKLYMILGTITMFFSGGLIPTFIMFRNIGLLNNFLVYVIPSMFNFYNMIIFVSFFRELPAGLEESAKLDGANDFTIFVKIIIPLSMPVIATIALFNGVWQWNDYFTGVIYIYKDYLQPIQTYLYRVVAAADGAKMSIAGTGNVAGQQVSSLTVNLATMVVTTLPIVCVYPFLQKYFVKGMLIGSIKG
ncbi:MAG: carbohydrate ABC transporter permease [Treponema sp.]|nr:carbohydrate ABC transporter permease [Spirochaetia bacterium]MDD7014195.1 carbohydrate ABC transporter permease [Spirochaetales bacterium]MDY4902965.1 carbohydrate ABC transporter permease [Treponema sp.]